LDGVCEKLLNSLPKVKWIKNSNVFFNALFWVKFKLS
jgi:hypothetical protein